MRKKRGRAPLSFRYVPRAKDGGIDQLITMQNHTDVSLVPTVRYVARDIWGRELPHVVTQTVHGSDRGLPLLTAGGTGHDILRFDGPGSRDVRGVDVELVDLSESDHPPIEADIRTVMIDLHEKATADPAEFWGIGLVNPNPFGVLLRVALVAFEEGERDHPRQVVDVVTLQGDIDVASTSNDIIWLPEDVRGQFDDVDHHLVPQVLV
ncbi:hypothetical protein [Aeromicrobium sp.]|uniref:hypothetical protein n=1 Tax=Aeromicrobium sp. TaxID=1871063 RepID=UPI003D6B311D